MCWNFGKDDNDVRNEEIRKARALVAKIRHTPDAENSLSSGVIDSTFFCDEDAVITITGKYINLTLKLKGVDCLEVRRNEPKNRENL